MPSPGIGIVGPEVVTGSPELRLDVIAAGTDRHPPCRNWHILTKLRMDAAHATMLLRALLVLTHSEIAR
ncbi:hypothetical protein [Nonomuraea jabiensis]|uniref:hypothetical protein n=1 Tax=Nonomuraea jabiensis TaxID=882448 RepID=UPI003D7618F1